jgi:peptidoglycan-associated lipoprotein
MKLGRSSLVLVLLAVVAAGCGGKKRPPAVTTTAGSGATSGAQSGRGTETQPIDQGPDIRSVQNEGVGQDILSDANGEGGPLEDIRFNYDEATLTDEARATLDRHVAWLGAHGDVHVRVEGHCDQRGTVEYNLALGERRAQAAREYLVSKGIPADRLTSVSYGKERPLDTGTDEAAYARNRRAHFAVSR